MNERPDFNDDYDEDDMRRPGEPLCQSCERPGVRVVKYGMCDDCNDITEATRAESQWRRRTA